MSHAAGWVDVAAPTPATTPTGTLESPATTTPVPPPPSPRPLWPKDEEQKEPARRCQPPGWLVVAMLSVLACSHDVYLAVVNCVRRCNPPRPAADVRV